MSEPNSNRDAEDRHCPVCGEAIPRVLGRLICADCEDDMIRDREERKEINL